MYIYVFNIREGPNQAKILPELSIRILNPPKYSFYRALSRFIACISSCLILFAFFSSRNSIAEAKGLKICRYPALPVTAGYPALPVTAGYPAFNLLKYYNATHCIE